MKVNSPMRFTSFSICLFLACGLLAFGADKDEKAQALAKLLVQDDDELPDGITGGAAKTDQKDAPPLFRKIPKAQVFATRPLEQEGEFKGSVTAFAYTSPATRASVYKTFTTEMGDKSTKLEGIGEKGVMAITVVDVAGLNYSIADVAFIRGNQVVFVRLMGKDPAEDAKAHAKRLDQRLKDAPK